MNEKNLFTNSIKVEGLEKRCRKRQRSIEEGEGLEEEERESEREMGTDGKSTASNAHNEINFQSIAAT